MIHTSSIFDFLNRLKENNSKEWFDANRKEYEQLKDQLKNAAAEMISLISSFDSNIGSLEPKDCLFRINRDVRFSANKSPYKTNIGMSFTKGGKKSMYAGYYLHIQPENESFVAGGLYMPPAEIVKKIRDEIDYNPTELEKILADNSFKKYFGQMSGDKLAKPPKGYHATHPQIELLKHKSFLMWYKIPDSELIKLNVVTDVCKIFEAMKPLNDYLNKAIDNEG
jgi:uncharacterized protein (TIGR02453 family)